MNWWRQSRDASGMTIVDRLKAEVALLNRSIHGFDWSAKGLGRSLIKRIRSILRRLKRCPRCHATGKVYATRMRMKLGEFDGYKGELIKCSVCGGKGTVSFDTKEGTQDARTN